MFQIDDKSNYLKIDVWNKHQQGLPRRLLWEELELKTPQERSDEEIEAKPGESAVAVPAAFFSKIKFDYSLKHSQLLWGDAAWHRAQLANILIGAVA